MKKLLFTLLILVGFAMQATAQNFQSGDLLYSVIGSNPPCVSLDGHVDGTNAQGELVIPETVEHEGVSYAVMEIGDRAFLNCSGLTGNLYIPSTISIIGKNAFHNCSGFTSLEFSYGLVEIREFAFRNCSGLNGTLTLPQSLIHIKYGAFNQCVGFSGDLIIPNSVIEIGTTLNDDYFDVPGEYFSTFANCFDHLVLSESLDSIGTACFSGCSRLHGELVISHSVRGIKSRAFINCSGFNSLTLGNSLDYVGFNAFEGCSGFNGTLVIPESLTTIRSEAFSGCSGLEHIELSPNIRMEYYDTGGVFSECTGLTSIDIPSGWTLISNGTFNYCTNLTEVNLPESLEVIGREAFKNCRKLGNVKLPKKLKEIDNEAFAKCIEFSGDLEIPSQVVSILPFAFDSCYKINRLVLGVSVETVLESAFRNTGIDTIIVKASTPPDLIPTYPIGHGWMFPVDIPITVQCSTLESYQNSEFWSRFTNMSEGNTLSLSVISEDETLGEVAIRKEATCDDMSVVVEAMPNDGNVFQYWEANGEQVSTDNPYRFELEEDTNLIAHFSGLGLNQLEHIVSLYPNPTSNRVIINGLESFDIQIYNILGQPLKTKRISNEVIMDGIPDGVYFLCIIDEENRTMVFKVMKKTY